MPKLVLNSGQELSCLSYVQNGVMFDGSFAFAKTVDETLKSDDPVRIDTDHGNTTLINLDGMTYSGKMTIQGDGTFIASLEPKETVMSQTDKAYINVAKILLGEETEL